MVMQTVQFHISATGATFDLDLASETSVGEVKKAASETLEIEPEYMRFVYRNGELKNSDTLAAYEGSEAVQVLFTAGHTALCGGSKLPRPEQRNPFSTPVRGLPGSKGERQSRVSGRLGGMGLIRKYGILMKRQEFREKAEEIGFKKYR
eukprot:TRINITY_DN2149_c0_g1_i1.p1 TRINITY_DN2149_c0_g1~~TRINITY_DN2149_c0_g1_i1.p1  ORF type:complete len:149 (+),score=45.87 TRINITY_DN2149_c0_g1_i1:88-534(+)